MVDSKETLDWFPKDPITDPLELTRFVRDVVIKHPESHNQHLWLEDPTVHDWSGPTCRTAACVAGWAALASGWLTDGRNTYVAQREDGDLYYRDLWYVAAEALGFQHTEDGEILAEELFSGTNETELVVILLDEHIKRLEKLT